MAYDLGNPQKLLIGTEQGLLFSVSTKTSSTTQRKGEKKRKSNHLQYAPMHTGPVVSIHRNPILSRYFLTAGDCTFSF